MNVWPSKVDLIQDGETVGASVTNRPLAELAARTEFLKGAFDATLSGQALLVRDAVIADGVLLGAAVYQDSDGVWKASLAEADTEAEFGYFVLKRTAAVHGVVIEKLAPSAATICLFGYVPVDLSAALEGTVGTGQHYLSSNAAGKLTRRRPALAISVLYYDHTRQVAFVNPSPRDTLDDHQHLRFELYAMPAGIPSCGEVMYTPVEVSCPDDALPGWLNADHAIFNGLAPSGAKFGYNLSAHPALQEHWPPIPLASAYIELDGVGVRISDDPTDTLATVLITADGLWWMKDLPGSLPWPEPWTPCAKDGLCSDIDYGDGSNTYQYLTMMLYFAHMLYKTESNVVTSLVAKAGSPIIVTSPTGTASKTGPLMLSLGDVFTLAPTPDDTSPYALKGISGSLLTRGPVVTSLVPGSANVSLTGTIGDVTSGFSGRVTVDLTDPTAAGRELDVQLIELNQATEETYLDLQYLGLPSGISSGMRLKAHVPEASLTGGSGTLKLRLWLFMTASFTAWPTLSASYRKLPKPASPTVIPTAEQGVLTITPTPGNLASYTYVQIESTTLDVSPGDEVFITLARTLDSIPGTLGVLKIVPVLTPQ